MLSLSDIVPAHRRRLYDDEGEPVLNLRERALLRLRWLDWTSAAELSDLLGIEVGSRNVVSQMLRRFHRQGIVEREGEQVYRYRVIATSVATRQRVSSNARSASASRSMTAIWEARRASGALPAESEKKRAARERDARYREKRRG